MNKLLTIVCVAVCCWMHWPAQVMAQDTLILGEAFVNLSLTIEYYDSLDENRLDHILPFEEKQLNSLKSDISRIYPDLYHLAHSQWHFIDAKHLSQKGDPTDRKTLISWKNALEPSIQYFQNVSKYFGTNDFYEFVEFDNWDVYDQEGNISSLKSRFTPLFNQNIYDDFKRIFYRAKNSGGYHFDSLSYYSALFNIPFDTDILENKYSPPDLYDYEEYISLKYRQASALDLITRYLQLDFVAYEMEEAIDTALVFAAYEKLVRDLDTASNDFYYQMNEIIPKDTFFQKELNQQVCEQLYQQLQEKYPFNDFEYYPEYAADAGAGAAGPGKYYFPTPAPYPTAKVAIRNFKPELKKLKDVDLHIRQSFVDAGYEGRLHYFYIREPGFAVTTGIERINKDGSPVEGNMRWDLKQGGEEGLSLYQVFRAMFFKTQSDYRLIACVVSADEIRTSSQPTSMSEMSSLLRNRYSTLPSDLENLELIEKTITVLVYHYTQDEIGMVPMLNQNTILNVYDHLNNTPNLSQLTSL